MERITQAAKEETNRHELAAILSTKSYLSFRKGKLIHIVALNG